MVTVFHHTPVNAKQFNGLNIDGLARKRQNPPPSKFCAIRYTIYGVSDQWNKSLITIRDIAQALASNHVNTRKCELSHSPVCEVILNFSFVKIVHFTDTLFR